MATSLNPEQPDGAGVPWGHSIAAHNRLGWCCQCPGITAVAEVLGWRLLAQGEPKPDIERARQWSEQ